MKYGVDGMVTLHLYFVCGTSTPFDLKHFLNKIPVSSQLPNQGVKEETGIFYFPLGEGLNL